MATATTTIDQKELDNQKQSSSRDSALATRGSRLVATIIDGLMMSAVSIPMTMAAVMVGVPPILAGIVGMAAGIAAFSAVNFRMLESRGQTFGKRTMGVQIVSDNDSLMPAKTVLLKRYLPMWGVAAIPFLGGLLAIANAVLIFGSAQKCGHDMIAGTKVINRTQD